MPTEDKGLMSQVQRRLQRSSRKTINPQKCGRRCRGDSQACRPVTHAALGLQSLPGPAGRRPPPAARRPGFYEEKLKLHRKLQQELSKHPPATNQGPPPRGHLGFGGDRAESELGHQDAKRGAVARGALSSLLSAACLAGLLASRTVPGPPP